MKKSIFVTFVFILGLNQSINAQQAFHSFDELFAYAKTHSISLQSNTIKISQAKRAKLAALLSVPDVTGNLFSATFTDNTKLGVNLFPAEAFGGTPGTYRTVQTGIQYNTNLNNYVDVKLINLSAIYNLQLAKVNIQLSESNSLLTLKTLKENVASSYYNLVALQKQYETSLQNKLAADTLFAITKNKYSNGLAKQQDVNDAQASLLSNKENANQIQFLINQTYLTIKLLCDIPEQEEILIAHTATTPSITTTPLIEVNNLKLSNYALQEKYALNSYKSAKSAFAPTLSAPFSNSYNIYSSTFKVLDGNWINSNFIGLKLNVPIPSANVVAKKYSSYYEYQLAEKNTQQAKIKAQLEQEQLKIEYEKAVSKALLNKEILILRQDSYLKNKLLYSKGLIGLEQTINSFNTMVNANYNLIFSQTSVELAFTKIEINNSIK